MRRKPTLEPQIIQHLREQGNIRIDELIRLLHEKTGVTKEKIQFRIQKMVTKKKLKIENGLISIGNKKK